MNHNFVTKERKRHRLAMQFRHVDTNPIIRHDDKWMEGRAPPPTEMNFYEGTYSKDPDYIVPSYDVCPCEFENADVHIEKRPTSVFMNRNGKDRSLTTQECVQKANQWDPMRSTYITPETYSRSTNKLQHYWHGVTNRVENLNGKRKYISNPVRPSTVNGESVERMFDVKNPIDSVNANLPPSTDRRLDALTNYPNIVQFTLDTMTSVPAAVDDSKAIPGKDLAKAANRQYEKSITRFT